MSTEENRLLATESSGVKSACFLFLLCTFNYTATNRLTTDSPLGQGVSRWGLSCPLSGSSISQQPLWAHRSMFDVIFAFYVFIPLLFLILTGIEHQYFAEHKFHLSLPMPMHLYFCSDVSKKQNMVNAYLSYAEKIYFSKKNPIMSFSLIVSRQLGTPWPEKEAYSDSTGIKMSNAGGGGDTSSWVFRLSGRALWTLSTQSGQRVASITVTVSAPCNVGNNNSFKTLQWGVTALCRTWESHLWQAAEKMFWTQSLQRAICFDSSVCFLFKLSLDLIDDPFLLQRSLFCVRRWEKTNGKWL